MTRERMLREFASVVEALTAEAPLVLVLEDLHWSDYATLDLLALLARRQPPAQLLVLGTYRPLEVLVQGHPLRPVVQELQRYGRCLELPLALLGLEDITAYLHTRFPGQQWPAALVPWLHRHTDGNPLFLVTMIDTLLARGVLAEEDGYWRTREALDAVAVGVPEGLQPLLEQQLAQVAPEAQRVLEAASVTGVLFSAAAAATGLALDLDQVEEACAGLARQHLIRPAGMAGWPDGTMATCYAFTHALYQQVAYERLGTGRRAQLHQRIGLRLEAAYGPQAGEIAAELAVHFERGRDLRRAVQYLRQAGENALRRHAYHDALAYLSRGQELLRTMPETPERAQQELALHMTLGPVLTATQGYGTPAVRATYARAHALCQQVEDLEQRFWVLWGLQIFYRVRAELQTAWELGAQLLSLAQCQHEPTLLVEAHYALGSTGFWQGELLAARVHLEQSLEIYSPQQHYAQSIRRGSDPRVGCLATLALTLWSLGYPDQALARLQAALTLAQELAHPFSLAHVLNFAAGLHLVRREHALVQAQAEATIALATEQGFPHWQAGGAILHGWVLAEQGQSAAGITRMRQSIAAVRAMGAEVMCPWYLGLLAGAYGKAGQHEAGLSALAEALRLVDQHGERCSVAELCRLNGELLLLQDTPDEPQAEARFQEALAIARGQQARSWELRAAMSLARLWQRRGKRAAARHLLAEVYAWFTEGLDTADLQDARALLEELDV
jgi:predicted ATPase